MQLDLLPMKKFAVINKLEEVTNPVTFEKGAIPSSDGLLSTEIFGTSIRERREKFAIIDLHGHYFAPFIYKIIRRVDKKFEYVVTGARKYIITESGDLVQDDEKGKNGLKWLYDNWSKIKLKKNKSNARNNRIDLINSMDRDTIFVSQWVVIPAFYRDVNLQDMDGGKLAHHEINDLYNRLIRLSLSAADSNQFDFTFTRTATGIQNTLVEIYDLLKGMLEKKNGLIRKSLLGRSVDYGNRSVISAPQFNKNRPEDMDVDLYKSALPLSQTCVAFAPIVISWVRRFFERELEATGNKYPVKNKKGDIYYVKLKEPAAYFNEEFIMEKLEKFVHSPSDRFEKIELPVDDPDYKGKLYMTFAGRLYDGKDESTASDIINRPATWTDIFYQAAVQASEDRVVWITRYPILDYFGMACTRVHVKSTLDTVPVVIGNRTYPTYPNVIVDMPRSNVATYFSDTLTISNLYLKGNGGDYDGDQVSARGVFSQEAVAEGLKIMKSKSYILNVYGENIRATTNEGIQSAFMFTKFDK